MTIDYGNELHDYFNLFDKVNQLLLTITTTTIFNYLQDGDGYITLDEWMSILSELELNDESQREYNENMFKEADINNDGKLSFDGIMSDYDAITTTTENNCFIQNFDAPCKPKIE